MARFDTYSSEVSAPRRHCQHARVPLAALSRVRWLLTIVSACTLVVACATSGTNPVGADSPSAGAAQDMRDAAAICLRNFRNLDAALAELRARGWSTKPWIDRGSYEFRRGAVSGIVAVPGYCTVQTNDIDLDRTRAIGTSLVSEYFPDEYQSGRPEGKAQPCDGYTLFPGRGLIVMSYSAAGNSGECIQNSGGAIILRISA